VSHIPSLPTGRPGRHHFPLSPTRYLVGFHLHRGVWTMDIPLIESFPIEVACVYRIFSNENLIQVVKAVVV
jgi:hypothetical protein